MMLYNVDNLVQIQVCPLADLSSTSNSCTDTADESLIDDCLYLIIDLLGCLCSFHLDFEGDAEEITKVSESYDALRGKCT
jgi:hypothetical protein